MEYASTALYPFITGIHWRDTALPVRFFFLDARVLCALLLWAVHMCVATFCLACLGMCFFVALEWFGIRVDAFLRLCRTALFGPKRPLESTYPYRRRVLC